MARYRTLKPETFADEKLNECAVELRFLFVGLWCFVDDMGRRQYFPKRIKNEVFPGDDKITPRLVDSWMHDLDHAGVLRIYTVNGQTFFWLPHFLRHQKIDRPSHSDIPAHPADRDPDCRCIACKITRDEAATPRHYHQQNSKGNSRNVPDLTRRVIDEPSTTRRVLDERSMEEVGEVGEVGELNQNQDQHQKQTQPQNQNQPSPESNRDNPPPRSRAVEEIARRMLQLLELPINSQLLQALIKSIKKKARSKQCSEEAAAQQISASAAFVASENPPENWEQWLEDAGYEYVVDGDERLRDRHIWARPVCGSGRCSEGWETVKVGNVPVLRRCPDCERLWRDRGGA